MVLATNEFESGQANTANEGTQTIDFISVDIPPEMLNDKKHDKIDRKISEKIHISLTKKQKEMAKLENALDKEFVSINAELNKQRRDDYSDDTSDDNDSDGIKGKILSWISVLKFKDNDKFNGNGKQLIKTAHFVYILSIVGLLFNVISIGIASFYDDYYTNTFDKSHALFTSILWLILGIPYGYVTWYKNLYNLLLDRKNRNYYIYKFTFIFHLLFTCIMLSGCPWYPCAGIFFTVTTFLGRLQISFLFSFINSIIWMIILAYSFHIYNNSKVLIKRKHKIKEINHKFQEQTLEKLGNIVLNVGSAM